MAETLPRGIQATLYDYFQDTEYFDIQEANELLLDHQQRDINAESIRARIYEGIDKGLFERVGKGLYTVTRKDEQGRENTCLLINGDGRDLSIFADNSIDALITDHPYDTKKSLKGGNRNFADYELFQYTEKDFQEKHRILKPGHFLVEFLPEENADNYQYLFQVKEMARKSGLEYYAKVGWKKGDFVANTGRKSKNTEDICFFTKGRARELRPDAKKNKAEERTPDNIFESNTDVIVNPVNLMGVMGAGLAKRFKENIPGLEGMYKVSCVKRENEPTVDGFRSPTKQEGEIICNSFQTMFEGDLFLYSNPVGLPNGPRVLCFPTKRHWNEPSDLNLIENGLRTFVENYEKFNIQSITFPKLGCGLGGLDWNVVKPLMRKYLDPLPIEVRICGEPIKNHFMSGAAGMLPTVFDVSPPAKKERIHQAEKPVELLEQILNFVTLPGETVLDQFAGSGVLGEAALKTGRNSILIEKDVETFQKLTERIQLLGTIEAVTPAAQTLIRLGTDALIAQDAFERTGDRKIISDFVETHDIPNPSILFDGEKELENDNSLTSEQKEAIDKAFDAIEDIDLRSSGLDVADNTPVPSQQEKSDEVGSNTKKVLECSVRGDRRFSALFAKVSINKKERSIEEWYQDARRTADGKKAGKGKPFDHIVDPFTGDKLPANEAPWFYRGLWITYLSNNPDLVEYASQFDEFSNAFSGKGLENCPEEIIGAYVKGDRQRYVDVVRCSQWYKNMASKKKAALSKQILAAESRCNTSKSIHDGKIKKTYPMR